MLREVQISKSRQLQKALARKNQSAIALLREGVTCDDDKIIELAKDYWAADDEVERLRKESRP
jgi:hypothetical protein